MFTFKQFISESTLHVFDIDDTLFKTSAKVVVKKGDKIIRSLSSSEYNKDKLKDGEVYDFDEFRSAKKFKDESEPMQDMLDTLNRVHNKIKMNLTPGSKIIMNTARGDFDERETFLGKFRDHKVDIDDIHVHRAGNVKGDQPTAAKKLVFIRGYLKSGKYNSVMMYDDSEKNLDHFLGLREEFPDVKFHAYLVKHNGKLVQYNTAEKVTEDDAELKEKYQRWKKLVNMPSPTLQKFIDSDTGKDAGLSRQEASSLGIKSGRDSARAILRMRAKPFSEWTADDIKWMNRQISFVSRMTGNQGPMFQMKDGKKVPTRKLTSLWIWGNVPAGHSPGTYRIF